MARLKVGDRVRYKKAMIRRHYEVNKWPPTGVIVRVLEIEQVQAERLISINLMDTPCYYQVVNDWWIERYPDVKASEWLETEGLASDGLNMLPKGTVYNSTEVERYG